MHASNKPINRVPLFALFTANAISMVGNVLTMIAIPWFVLQTTGSATQTGITGFFSLLPVVIAGLFGGALVDRLGYKRTSIAADLASGLTTALIPILYFTIGLQFWQLMVLVFFGALLDTPGSTARSALIPELAELAGMPIERATSLNQIVERSSRLLGAPLAGLLIALMSTANVLWLDAISFFISAAMVAVLIKASHIKLPETARGKYADELRAGLRFLRRDHLLLALMFTIMLTNGLDAAYASVVRPVYVDQVWGSAFDLGVLIAANAAGAILGAVIYGAIGHRLPRHATFVTMFMLTGSALLDHGVVSFVGDRLDLHVHQQSGRGTAESHHRCGGIRAHSAAHARPRLWRDHRRRVGGDAAGHAAGRRLHGTTGRATDVDFAGRHLPAHDTEHGFHSRHARHESPRRKICREPLRPAGSNIRLAPCSVLTFALRQSVLN